MAGTLEHQPVPSPAPRQHHVSTTSAPRQHRASATVSSTPAIHRHHPAIHRHHPAPRQHNVGDSTTHPHRARWGRRARSCRGTSWCCCSGSASRRRRRMSCICTPCTSAPRQRHVSATSAPRAVLCRRRFSITTSITASTAVGTVLVPAGRGGAADEDTAGGGAWNRSEARGGKERERKRKGGCGGMVLTVRRIQRTGGSGRRRR